MTGRGIREAQPEDFAQVLFLLRQLWPTKDFDPARTETAFLAGLAQPGHEYLVLSEGTSVLGFASAIYHNSLWLDGEVAILAELVVEESARGRGLGSSLLEEVCRRAEARGCRRVELDSAFHRTEAHRFYESRGFEKRAWLFSKELGAT